MYEGKQVSLIGVDWSLEALKAAKKHYPCGVYIQADVRHTGLPTEQFDTVILSGVLDYFKDWQEVLVEARRLRRPRGKILATLLNGFEKHDWTGYPHITGNWHLYKE
jgi:ubiquinone/menaquinone biosynthesis C-methylase UbiE